MTTWSFRISKCFIPHLIAKHPSDTLHALARLIYISLTEILVSFLCVFAHTVAFVCNVLCTNLLIWLNQNSDQKLKS